MLTFASFIDSGLALQPRLPYFHGTDGHSFRAILESRQLEPQACPVYGETLLYLFYGKPSYRVNAGEEASRLRARLPVCFILSPDILDSCKRIVPFDSGAFAGKIYSQFISPNMKLPDFELAPFIESAQKLISRFFESNNDYYWGKANANVSLPVMQFEAEAYYYLILDSSKGPSDDRSCTIELQTDHPVELTVQTVEAVVLPEQFLEDDRVREILVNEWVAEPICYDFTRMKPVEYSSVVYHLAGQYLSRKGLL